MDFISNLIKRPISLVLNDASAASPSTASFRNSEGLQKSRSVENVNLSSSPPLNSLLIASAMNTSLGAVSNASSTGSLKACSESIDEDLDNIESSAAYKSEEAANVSSLALNTISHSSSHNAAMEDLINQIAQSLNVSSRSASEKSSAEGSLNNSLKDFPLKQQSPMVNKNALLVSNTNKSASNHVAPSLTENKTHQTEGSPIKETISKDVFKEKDTNKSAAGTAYTTENHQEIGNYNTQIEIEGDHSHSAKEILFNVSMQNNNTTHFFGMTEFDETKIPNLPGNLSAELEDPLKLTFDESVIPSSTIDMSSPSSRTISKAASAESSNKLNVPHTETDAATSSDNEIFVDCQSDAYTEQSEIDTFRSATSYGFFKDNSNLTSNSLANIQEPFISNSDACDDCEPMDVDSSITIEDALESQQILPEQKAEKEIVEKSAILSADESEHLLNSTITVSQEEEEKHTDEDAVGLNCDENGFRTPLLSTPRKEEATKQNQIQETGVSTPFSSAHSSTTASPGFPLRQSEGHQRFPSSPQNKSKKQTIFLEQSEYSINSSKISEAISSALNLDEKKSNIIAKMDESSDLTAIPDDSVTKSPKLKDRRRTFTLNEPIIESLTMPPPQAATKNKLRLTTFSIQGESIEDLTPALSNQLSAKEQIKIEFNDEKDVVSEGGCTTSPIDDKFVSSSLDDAFNTVSDNNKPDSVAGYFASEKRTQFDLTKEQFVPGNEFLFQPSDFDFLLTAGSNSERGQTDRNSLLVRFDPLLGAPVPIIPKVNQEQPKLQTLAESEPIGDFAQVKKASTENAKMSVDVISDLNNIENNDTHKSFENSNTKSDEKHQNFKMDGIEKKIQNEVLRTEDIEKKLRDAEQREESLIKRITEKDKIIAKLTAIIEEYEKTISISVSDKEQCSKNHNKEVLDLKADRDANYLHLMSLETTFSDLHVKYEKSKEMTANLKSKEEELRNENRQLKANLHLQEQRYEKMKNHAMQQLEIANKKLQTMNKEHAVELTKLKAHLKKEEVSRASMTEQLQQKSRENEELLRICDELINGQGS